MMMKMMIILLGVQITTADVRGIAVFGTTHLHRVINLTKATVSNYGGVFGQGVSTPGLCVLCC